ncbi:MAG: NlpC/P60 family protein [Chitinophagales bacterium]
MEFAVCIVPAAPVRKKPSHKVEMVNQLLFGEGMHILKQKNKWMKVQSAHDHYDGWIRSNLISQVEDNLSNNSFVAGDLINTIVIKGTKMKIPAGSTLFGLDNGRGKIGNLVYEFSGISFKRDQIKADEAIVQQLTMAWLNAPYLWGGRTPLGVDCSGFVQVIFKMMGIDLLRDAKQQSAQGMKIKKLNEAHCGDLAFFKNNKGKITHVGILFNTTQILHASGKVRIDTIDEKGIVHSDTGKRTHMLTCIRRYWK